MDFQALKSELLNDPSNLGYYGKTDDEAAALINSKTINQIGAVPISDVLIWAGGHGAIDKLDAHASDANGIGNICKVAKLMFGSVQSLDLNNSKVSGLLTTLVSAGVFLQADADDLIALGVYKISRADQLGLGEIQSGDIAHAREI